MPLKNIQYNWSQEFPWTLTFWIFTVSLENIKSPIQESLNYVEVWGNSKQNCPKITKDYGSWPFKIKVLRNQGLFQTLEKFQVLQTLIFFQVSTLKKGWVRTINLKEIQLPNLKKIKVCRTWNFSRVWNRPWFLKTLIFRN